MAFRAAGREPNPSPVIVTADGFSPCPMGNAEMTSLKRPYHHHHHDHYPDTGYYQRQQFDRPDEDSSYQYESFKRAKQSNADNLARSHTESCPPKFQPSNSFIVIREQQSAPTPSDESTTSCSMERTASGLSISSDTTAYTTSTDDEAHLLSDHDAARLVEGHLAVFRRRAKGYRHERILRSLIEPRSRSAEFELDDAALEGIFSAANEIFFNNKLTKRVRWDWSHASNAKYQDHIIGTTAVRRSAHQPGYETLIVLSKPILQNKKYNRRLIISTFLHELIHSYLFICCGFKARACGGHTAGFRRIAELIDLWAGSDNLHLCDMEADLDHFKQRRDEDTEGQDSYEEPRAHVMPHSSLLSHPTTPSPEDYDYLSPYHPQALRHRQDISVHLDAHPGPWEFGVNDGQEQISLSKEGEVSRPFIPDVASPEISVSSHRGPATWDYPARHEVRQHQTALPPHYPSHAGLWHIHPQPAQQSPYPPNHHRLPDRWDSFRRAASLSPSSSSFYQCHGSPYVN